MLSNSKKLSSVTATCMPDERAERVVIIKYFFAGISANYGYNEIVFIRLDPRSGNYGEGHGPKESFTLQKCNKTLPASPLCCHSNGGADYHNRMFAESMIGERTKA